MLSVHTEHDSQWLARMTSRSHLCVLLQVLHRPSILSVQCYQSLTLVIMPSAVENAALLFGGAVAGTALTTAFVAPGPVAQEAKTGLRASGYSRSQSSSGMGTMAGMGAIAGLAAAGVAGKRVGKNRTSMQAVGVGINGFGRIGRQVARIAMKDPETELKLINASYDADYLAYMMRFCPDRACLFVFGTCGILWSCSPMNFLLASFVALGC